MVNPACTGALPPPEFLVMYTNLNIYVNFSVREGESGSLEKGVFEKPGSATRKGTYYTMSKGARLGPKGPELSGLPKNTTLQGSIPRKRFLQPMLSHLNSRRSKGPDIKTPGNPC